MLRKLITACAGVMMAGTAVAADVTGTYASQANGQNLTLELQEQNGMVRGLIHLDGTTLPLVGQEQGGQIQGLWQGQDGQQYTFAARLNGGQFELATNGVTYSLQRNSPAPQAMPEPMPAPVLADPQQDPRPVDRGYAPQQPVQQQPVQQDNHPFGTGEMTVHMEQGQIFARPVPSDWKSGESSNETFVYANDGSMAMGFTGMEAITPTTPADFLQFMMCTVYKHTNLRILDQREVPGDQGSQTIEAVVSFNGANDGKPYMSWIRCTVMTAFNSSNGYMQFATATPEKFQAAIPTLIQMAEKIQIIDQNAAFDRARRLGVIQSIKNNPIPDTIIVGYNERQQIMDGVSARRSDVATNTYTWTDPSTGRQYTGGQENVDPTAGGVRNPERPTEILEWAKHWQGHLPQ